MDSMRHLSTSLPGTSSRQRHEQSSDILTEFKAAALSVTNLYKSAASSQARARAAGYQDALDELLVFLDKENLGLMDGEGWKVRQWATERLDTDIPNQRQATTTDDEDETHTIPDKDDERSSSPEIQRKPTTSDLADDDAAAHHRRVVSEPPQPPTTAQLPALPTSDFTFQSSHPYPTNHDRTPSGSMDVDRSTPRVSRPSRQPRRNTEARVSSLNFNVGAGGGGAGSKRKMPYPDFFDISGFHDGMWDRKDGGGGGGGSGRGGKRGRHV